NDKNNFNISNKYQNIKHNLYTYKMIINDNIPENILLKSVLKLLLKEINSINKEINLKIENETSKHNSKYKSEIKKAKITKYNLEQSKKNIVAIKNLIIKLRLTE